MSREQFITTKIVIGCDHAGFHLKQVILDYLKSINIEYLDVGCFDTNQVDYPDIAAQLCYKINSGEYDKGILLCGTGIGISISANKIKGIRCALCHDVTTARLARQHNDANVLALGGRTTGSEVAKDIVHTFLTEHFLGEHHVQRIEKIKALEDFV